MPIAFESVATNTFINSTSMIGNKPSGLADGDLLVMHAGSTSATPSVTAAPSGWTQLTGSPQDEGTDSRSFVYYKAVTNAAGEPASWTWTLSGSGWGTCDVMRFSGVNTSSPIHTSAAANSASTATPVTGSITTTVADTMLLALYTCDETASGTNFTASPDGMTERYDHEDASQFGVGAGFTGLQASAASGITKTATASTSDSWATWLIALEPAASGGTTYSQSTSGTVSMAGTVVKGTARGLTGSLGTSGSLGRLVSRLLAGSITLSPALVRSLARSLASSLGLSSALLAARSYARSVSSSLALAGTVVRLPNKRIADSLAMSGDIRRHVSKVLASGLTVSGGIMRRLSRLVSGALGLASSLGSLVSSAPELPSPAVKRLIVKTGGVMVMADTGRLGVVVDTGVFTLGVRVE